MQRSIALSAFCLAFSAYAQNCTVINEPTPADVNVGQLDGVKRPDGGLYTLNSTPGRGFAVTRWASDGTILWAHKIPPTNPLLWPLSHAISNTAAGGCLVTGDQRVGGGYYSYENMFAAELNDQGEPLWARMYMLDSNLLYYPNPVELIEQPGNGYLFVAWGDSGTSVSRLDAAGIPQWTRRYSIGTHGFYPVLADDNGGFTMFSYLGQMARCSSDGTVQWAKNYQGPNYIPFWLVRKAQNGDYITVGGPVGPDAILARVTDQGDVLWRRTFQVFDYGEGETKISLQETASGHILVMGSQQLFEMDANGVMLGAWEGNYVQLQASDIFHLIQPDHPLDDALVFGFSRHNGTGANPAIILTPGTSDLDCALTPFAIADTLTTGLPTPTPIAVTVHGDSLKTWLMNIDLAGSFMQRDPYCFIMPMYTRPGFQHQVHAAVQNGTIMPTGPITATLTFPTESNYVSAVPAPSSVVGQTITWQLPAMGAYSQQFMTTTFQTPADPGLIGDTIHYTLSFTQDSSDTDLSNNTVTKATVIWGAYDPNVKEVIPAEQYVLGTDSILEYTIRFQNTGNAAATNVTLVDTLPLDVDVTTFKLLGYTHPCSYTLSGNGILVFHFYNINLPDSGANEAASHGAVTFRIKPMLPLMVGQEITNRADIVFDFNPPIRTDDATVVVSIATGVMPTVKPDVLAVFPVPVDQTLTAVVPADFMAARAWVVGVDGRQIPLSLLNASEGRVTFNAQRLAPGGYVLTLWNKEGRRLSARFTKQ